MLTELSYAAEFEAQTFHRKGAGDARKFLC
jgi:hypothetical protein